MPLYVIEYKSGRIQAVYAKNYINALLKVYRRLNGNYDFIDYLISISRIRKEKRRERKGV